MGTYIFGAIKVCKIRSVPDCTREAQLEKVPYMLIVGEKEMNDRAVLVRSGKEGDKGAMANEEFISMLAEKVEKKVL